MTFLPRSFLLAALVAGYCAVFTRLRAVDGARPFDPLEPRGRQVETATEAGRFDEAVPVALSLRESHDSDPDVLYWLGEIYRGLGRTADEIEMWREYARASTTPEEVCPALPLAYLRAGDTASALREFEACVSLAPDDPERLLDLAAEHARQGHIEQALFGYARAGALDPGDPRIPVRIAALQRGGSE